MQTRESRALVSPPRRVMAATRAFAFPIEFFHRTARGADARNPVAVLAAPGAPGGSPAASFFYAPTAALPAPAGSSLPARAAGPPPEQAVAPLPLTPQPERFEAGAIIALADETVTAAAARDTDPAGEVRLDLSPAIPYMSAKAMRTTDREVRETEMQPAPAARGDR